jgi:hypothetical protein
VILTERSEVDGESRRKPAVTIRAGVRGVGSDPLVVAIGQLPPRHACAPVAGSVSARGVRRGDRQHLVLVAPSHGCEPDLDSVGSGSLGSGAGGR